MDIQQLLEDAIRETGSELRVNANELRVLIAQEASRLILAQNEPGLNRVLRASRDRILLEMGIDASERASAAEQRIVGIIHGLLVMLVAV